MSISAVFVVQEFAIKDMIGKEEGKRFDYLLGLDDNQNFGEYLLDMEDFMDTPTNFYSLLQKEWSFLEYLKMSCLYKSKQHSIYTITPKEVEQLNILFCKEEVEGPTSIFSSLKLEQMDTTNNLSAYTLIERAEQFISLIKSANAKGSYMLFMFENN